MKKRLFGLISAAVIGVTSIATAGIYASAASVGQKLTVGGGQTRHKDVCDGYSYEIWLDNTGGSGSMRRLYAQRNI